ncbi:MAG: MFS transporter [Luminiphilus sp.]|nr:MFS transporter [Luminiphilus sp.]MDG2136205.1 MFS transporter [Luminiphilus sp.]
MAESTRYRWTVLVMLTLVYTFNFIDRQILVILQEPIKADLGLSDAQLGLLTGFSFALVYVTAGIPIAWLADRANRRNIIATSLAFWSLMTAMSGLVQNYGQLLVARLGVGVGEAGGTPPAHSMISDYFPPSSRGTALSFYSMGIYIGVLFGFAAGGWIAENFGWRNAFFVIGIPGILYAFAVLWVVKEPKRGHFDPAGAGAPAQSSLSETMAGLRRRPTFWYLSVGCAFSAFVSYGNGNFMPSFLMRNHGLSLTEVGVILGLISGLSGATGTFLGGYMADRLATRDMRWYLWIPILGGLSAMIPAYYTLLGENTTFIVAAMIPSQILSALYLGPCIATCHNLVSPGMRAMASAILYFVLNLIGLGLGPLTVGILSDFYAEPFGDDNLRYAMASVLSIGFLGVYFLWMGTRSLNRDLEENRRELTAQR